MIDQLAAEARRSRGVPGPAWTKRPNANDDLRARAEQLRGAGWSVPDIAVELGVAKSTAYQWDVQAAVDWWVAVHGVGIGSSTELGREVQQTSG